MRDLTLQLDKRTGGIFYHGVRSLFQEMIHKLQKTGARSPPDRSPPPEQETKDSGAIEDAQSDGDAPIRNRDYWGGHRRHVHESSKFQDCPPLQLWQEWLCRNHELGYPPLRRLETKHLTRSMQKRMCDARKLMKAKQFGIVISQRPILSEANEIFHRCQSVIVVPEVSVNRRLRRKGQLGRRSLHVILHQLETRGLIEHKKSHQLNIIEARACS